MKTKIKLYYISLVYYFLFGIIILLFKEKLKNAEKRNKKETLTK